MPVTISRSETHPDCIVIDLGRTIPTALGCDFVLSDSSSGQFASPDGWRAERHVFKPLEIVRSNTTRLVIPFEHVATIVPGTMVSLLIGASSFRAQMNWPPDLEGPVANPDPPANNTAELEGVSEPTVAESLADPLEQPMGLDDKIGSMSELSKAHALDHARPHMVTRAATALILVCSAALAGGGWYALNKHNELSGLEVAARLDRAKLAEDTNALDADRRALDLSLASLNDERAKQTANRQTIIDALERDRAALDKQKRELAFEQTRLLRERDNIARQQAELEQARQTHSQTVTAFRRIRDEFEKLRASSSQSISENSTRLSQLQELVRQLQQIIDKQQEKIGLLSQQALNQRVNTPLQNPESAPNSNMSTVLFCNNQSGDIRLAYVESTSYSSDFIVHAWTVLKAGSCVSVNAPIGLFYYFAERIDLKSKWTGNDLIQCIDGSGVTGRVLIRTCTPTERSIGFKRRDLTINSVNISF